MQSNGLHPDTQVLLYLGGMKAAKSVMRGDILMGDDNTPRIVLSHNTGYDQLYSIIPEIGESFIIPDGHVLSLYNEQSNQITAISLREYIAKSPLWKIKHKIYSKPVEYTKQQTKNDAYMVGLLLASEKKSTDDIIKEYLSKILDNISVSVTTNKNVKTLDTIDKEEIGYLLNHKYIPDEYLYNTREIRLHLLKGFYEAATFVEKQESQHKKLVRSASQPVTKSAPIKKVKPHAKVSFNSPRSAPFKKKQKRAASHNHVVKKKIVKPVKKLRTNSKVRPSPKKSNLKKSKEPIRKIDSQTVKPRKSRLAEFSSLVIGKKSKAIKIKDKILSEQLKFLIRSLGYDCIHVAESIIIQTDIKEEYEPPPMSTKNKATFTVVQHTTGEYSKFMLDGNGRFLLASCVATHHGI